MANTLRESIERVLREYPAERNNPLKGNLIARFIRADLPSLVLQRLNEALPTHNLRVTTIKFAGNWAYVPWFAVRNPEVTTSTHRGMCVACLFAEKGNVALLAVIHMPTLFERFVARWLERASPPELEFIPKFSLRIESTHAVRLEVDLLCKSRATGQVLAVIDTKYKAPEKPSSDDLGQIALYSLQTGTKRAFLVYPSGQHGGFEARIGDVSIRSLTFDIGTPPRPDGDSFLRTLLGELRGTEAT